MNKILRYGIYIFIGMLILGCKTLATSVQNVRQNFIGKNINAVYIDWGAPSLISPLPSAKGTVYEWNSNGCKNIITADENGIVTDYNVNGNCDRFQ